MKSIQSWWGVGLMAVLLSMVTYQAVQLHNRPTGIVRPEPQWKPGFVVGELSGERLEGPKETFNLAGETLLYVMSPKCIWCTRNLENVQTLAQARGSNFIAISNTSEGLGQYIKDHRINYPVYHKMNKIGVSSTPSMVLVRDGVIKDAWYGAWKDANKAGIEKYFGLVLPGLTAD